VRIPSHPGVRSERRAGAQSGLTRSEATHAVSSWSRSPRVRSPSSSASSRHAA
jgi:hypothetical protein